MSFDLVAAEEMKVSANVITLMASWISQAPLGLFDLHHFMLTNACSLVLQGLHHLDYHFISTMPINPGKQKYSISKPLEDWSVCDERVDKRECEEHLPHLRQAVCYCQVCRLSWMTVGTYLRSKQNGCFLGKSVWR